MTYEDATKYRESLDVLWETYYDEDTKFTNSFNFRTALENVTECVEKQIPKKAYRHEEDYYVCPNCDCQITWRWFESYCEHCGQAIYRSEEE